MVENFFLYRGHGWRVHVDEELAICLTANWLLLRLRFAKQAKLLPGVCAGFYYCCSWALAFTFGRPLISALAFLATLPAPPLRTTLLPTPLATALLSDLGESGGHRTRKRESRRRRKERRLPHKSHSSYNMCRSLLWYARLAGGEGGGVCGGQCPLKTAPASCAPLQETFLEMQKFAQHKLCFVKMFTLFIVLLLLVASSAWLSLLGALTLPPIRTACYTEKNKWQLMLVTYRDDAYYVPQ